MGAFTTKAANKSSTSNDSVDGSVAAYRPNFAKGFKLATPFVLTRKGSMFFDQDGDLAHEFYEEVFPKRKGKKASMRRINSNLTPQGDVKYPVPMLHVDFHIIMCSS